MSDLESVKKVEALIALFQGALDRRQQLEAVEWKMNFSLWTALAVAAWALHTTPEHLGFSSLSFCLVIALHFLTVYRFAVSAQRSVALAIAYVQE